MTLSKTGMTLPAGERLRLAHVEFSCGQVSATSTEAPSGAYGERHMLGWALTFLVVALIAAVLGFTTIAGAAMGVAKILFYVFLVLFLVSIVMHLVRGRGVP
jgi:uncharacterized membrane protein YtjA (UPF0391 family)